MPLRPRHEGELPGDEHAQHQGHEVYLIQGVGHAPVGSMAVIWEMVKVDLVRSIFQPMGTTEPI
eukprot:8922252-Lingulodinium_polyedra.AAC.1